MEPFWVPAHEGKALPLIGVLKASGARTGQSFEVIEYEGPAAPPPHIHREREEAFYLLEGSFEFVLGTETFEAGTGSFVFVPRGTRHGFTPGPGARALLLVAPAGLEGFFEELGEGLEGGLAGSEVRAKLAGKYDSHPA